MWGIPDGILGGKDTMKTIDIKGSNSDLFEKLFVNCIILQVVDDTEKTLEAAYRFIDTSSNVDKISILLTFLHTEVNKLRTCKELEEVSKMAVSIESIIHLMTEEGVEGTPIPTEFFKRVEAKVLASVV